MRCPKCGGYSFDSDDRCLNCGYVISSKVKPPSWWGSRALRKSTTTSVPKNEAAIVHPPKLSICPNCQELSLFYNERDKMYECLNKKCRARGSSMDQIEPVQQTRRQRIPEKRAPSSHEGKSQALVGSKRVAVTTSTNVVSIWLESVSSKLSAWWRLHKPRRFRITKRGLSTSWGMFKKCSILASLLVVTTIIFAAVSLVMTEAISITSGVIIGSLGLALGLWCSNSLSLHKVGFARFFMIVVISVIFIMVSTAYLDIRSFTDVRDSIVGALSIPKS